MPKLTFIQAVSKSGIIIVFVYLCICDKAHLHPGHPKEWDEGERDQVEQGRLSRLENLQQFISLIYKLNLIFQFDIKHVLSTIDFSNVIQYNPIPSLASPFHINVLIPILTSLEMVAVRSPRKYPKREQWK